jgi:hypothetical protein
VAELDDPMLRQAIELYVSMYRLGMLHDLITLIDQQWDRFAEVSFELPDPWHTGCTAICDHITALAADPATPEKLRVLFAEASDCISKVATAESMLAAVASIPAPKFGNNGGGSWKETRDDVKARIETISAAVYECALGHILHVLVPIVLAVWALELWWSPRWLARHPSGPVEWGWRSLAALERQPWRRVPASAPDQVPQNVL